MRNPNGYGSIRKLSGNRRKPFQVLVTTGWKYEDGKARQIQQPLGYFKTRPEAMIALAEYNKSPYDIDAQTLTFSDIYQRLLPDIDAMKKNTARSWRAAYTHAAPLYDMCIVDIKKAHMQDILDELSDGSRSVQNNVKKLFRAVFKWSLENDIIAKDYSQFLKITAAKSENNKTPFSREEIDTLWKNIDYTDNKKYTSTRSVDTIILLIYTGMRISELLEMKSADVDLGNRILHVNGTKTEAARRITPIHKDIIPLLERRISLPSEFLVPDPNGNHMGDNNYRASIFRPVCSMLLKVNHTPHECRHTFITFAKRCKLDDLLLKKMVGHASQDITEDIYTHVLIEDLVSEIDRLDFK